MATIKEIQQRLELVTELSDSFLEEVAKDQRSGVQKAIEKRKRAIQAELDEDLRLEQMLRYEKELYQAGYQAIAGIDEVGRGPLAGPVVAAAVILPPGCKIKGLNDSKKIPKKKHNDRGMNNRKRGNRGFHNDHGHRGGGNYNSRGNRRGHEHVTSKNRKGHRSFKH